MSPQALAFTIVILTLLKLKGILTKFSMQILLTYASQN